MTCHPHGTSWTKHESKRRLLVQWARTPLSLVAAKYASPMQSKHNISGWIISVIYNKPILIAQRKQNTIYGWKTAHLWLVLLQLLQNLIQGFAGAPYDYWCVFEPGSTNYHSFPRSLSDSRTDMFGSSDKLQEQFTQPSWWPPSAYILCSMPKFS